MKQNSARLLVRLLIILVCAAISGLVCWGLALPPKSFANGVDSNRSSKQSQGNTKGRSRREAFVYFFDLAGDFAKVNIVSEEEVAHGQVVSAREVMTNESNFDGCVFCTVRVDPNSQGIYAVLAKEARVLPDGTKHYRIIAFEPTKLQQSEFSDLKDPLREAPSILIKPDGKELITSYQTVPVDQPADQLSFGISAFAIPDLKLLHTLSEATTTTGYISENPIKARFTDRAYFGPDGKIYDEFDSIALYPDKVSRSSINPSQLLTNSAGQKLNAYRHSSAGKSYVAVDYADAAAGKILVTLNAGKKAPQAILILDASTHELSRPIPFPEVSVHTAHLTPDAKEVLVEEFVWKMNQHSDKSEDEGSQPSLFRTGRFFVLSATTGKQIRGITAKELAGVDTRPICISPAEIAFYAVKGQLYALHLRTGVATHIGTNPGFRADQWTKFAFVDGSPYSNK